ncbi:LOW QUALITY PROTEIN: hypothetical protein U9M48_034868 [Paspalum notatum var. saurae]|uniref:Uncharacterized protein n=1 Tax=Paspalum notatum var. saurae TaxID=547442 RepID=A0AAQ3U9V5_PASNO
MNNQPGILGPHNADTNRNKMDDKLSALHSQRRAQGLCMKRGEKWSKTHKCPEKPAVQLEQIKEESASESSSDEDEVFQLSSCAAKGVQGKKTLKLAGFVGNQEILILLDSGSSCTFISSAVKNLQCSVQAAPSVTVTVANGQKVQSNQEVSQFAWWTQGHTFSHTARVLPLSCYDLVLGMDWLESHSPMWIHWKRKLLRFSHAGRRIALKGIKDSLSSCPKIEVRKLRGP